MACSNSQCSLNSIFNVAKGGGVNLANLIRDFESVAVAGGLVVYYPIKASFCIILEDN